MHELKIEVFYDAQYYHLIVCSIKKIQLLIRRVSVAKMVFHAIFQYNVLVIDIDNTTLGLI